MSKTALVTGASSGIGAAFARALAKEGHSLVLVARRIDRLEALAREVEALGVRATVLPADLTRPDGPKALFEAVNERGLAVDLLINNAGLGYHEAFAETPWEKELEMLQLNIQALTEMTRLFLPAMRQRRAGGIIQVASTAAFQPMPYFAVYAATKAYVLSFSEALADEVSPDGVRVVCLCPGPTHTEFGENAALRSDLFKVAPFMEADAVAEAGLAALGHGRVVAIPGALNAFGASGVRMLPRRWVSRFIAQVFRPKPAS